MFTKIIVIQTAVLAHQRIYRGGGGIVERTLTVTHDSYSLPKGRSVKLNFFAPTVYASLTSQKHLFKVE